MNVRFARWFVVGIAVALVVVGGITFIQSVSPQESHSYNCPSTDIAPMNGLWGSNSVQSSGFLMVGENGQGNIQFVLKPNSTAFLKIWYYTLDSAQDIYDNRFSYFRPIDSWLKLGNNESFVSSAQAGITATPINVTLLGNRTLIVEYEIDASASAERGAFILDFPGTCGPDLVLTIGASFYNGLGLFGGVYN